MATMRHIESRASTVSKVIMRPQLAELMDRSMESTNKLWTGDPKLLEVLKTKAEQLAANPTARKEEIADARREYEQYAYMYNKTNPSGGKPRKGNQYYNEASSTVSFLDGNKNVDESDFGSGPMVSRIRAATSMMQLGGSIATGALNLLSLVTNGVPYLASYNPKTAFVANFLGQSNLIKGTISGNDGDSHIVDLFGQKISLQKNRSHATDNSIYAGIRPEKFRISRLGTSTSGNILTGGHIEDVSYIGVSTQYQVEMPWGQELMVFEQNDDGVAPFSKGEEVNISWEPIFTFGLHGDEDANAGSEVNPDEDE
jgi:hypothetical protein